MMLHAPLVAASPLPAAPTATTAAAPPGNAPEAATVAGPAEHSTSVQAEEEEQKEAPADLA